MTAKIQTQDSNSAVYKFYHRYEHLAEQYAKRIFDKEIIGFEFDDLVQEFKIKIYLSIIAYARYVQKKRLTQYKPWPIELYIRCALANKTKDFIKQISETPRQSLSVEEDGFDYSIHHTMESHIILSDKVCKCEINGVDLLQGLTLLESKCFLLFLRGYTMAKLNRIFSKSIHEPSKVINRQITWLQTKKKELLENSTQKYLSFFVESEN